MLNDWKCFFGIVSAVSLTVCCSQYVECNQQINVVLQILWNIFPSLPASTRKKWLKIQKYLQKLLIIYNKELILSQSINDILTTVLMTYRTHSHHQTPINHRILGTTTYPRITQKLPLAKYLLRSDTYRHHSSVYRTSWKKSRRNKGDYQMRSSTTHLLVQGTHYWSSPFLYYLFSILTKHFP